jgi:DNA-binding transcriptional LysR family regulator
VTVSLDLLRTFLMVHRSGSVTAAAQLLGLAQPTVSAQIKALEARLERPLFDRVARGVVPLAAADELASRVAEPLDALEAVVFDEPSSTYPSTVHLGGPAEFVSEIALPALSSLIRDGLQVRVTLGLPDDLLDGLAARSLDLAITSVRPRRRGIVGTPIYDEEFVLVGAPSVAASIRRPVDADALRAVPLIAYADEAPILRRYWRTVFGVRFTRAPDVVVPDLRAARTAAVSGAGATVLPRYLCDHVVDAGDLEVLTHPEMSPLNTIFIAHQPAALAQRSVAAVHRRLLAID